MTATTKNITRIILLFVAAILAFSGSLVLLFDGGVNFGHTLYLLPVSGVLTYILGKTMSARKLVLFYVALIFAGVAVETLLCRYDLSLFFAGVLLNLVCFGIGCLIAYLFDKALFKKDTRTPTRVLTALLAVALAAAIVCPLMLFFGDPISATKSKNALNEWLDENPDADNITAQGFNYDWYDAAYYYEIKNSATGEVGKLIYVKTDGSVIVSWEE